MQSESNTLVLSALLTALKPLARLLMKVGIGYREFAEISKSAFVDVATNDYGLRGRPTNVSRVAVMTGLTRKEVKRIRDKISLGHAVETSKVIPPVEIIHQWHTDPEFLNEQGVPLLLSFDGSGTSFSKLVKKYGGDIPAGAMRTELKRLSAIRELPDGSLQVLRRYIRPLDKDDLIETSVGRALFGLLHSINHNIDLENSDGSGGWIQRLAWTTRIRDDDKLRVRRIARDRAEEFVTAVDDVFSAYETIYSGEGINDQEPIVGVGVYYFEAKHGDNKFFGK